MAIFKKVLQLLGKGSSANAEGKTQNATNNIGSEDFEEQISERGITWLISNLGAVKTEVLQFIEPGVILAPECAFLIPKLMVEFNHNHNLAVVYGNGKGHAFFDVAILKKNIDKHGKNITNFSTLANFLIKDGYQIKKVEYVRFEDNRRQSVSTESANSQEKIGMFTVAEWREFFLKIINEENKNPFEGMAQEHLEFNKKKFPDVVELARNKFGDF